MIIVNKENYNELYMILCELEEQGIDTLNHINNLLSEKKIKKLLELLYNLCIQN